MMVRFPSQKKPSRHVSKVTKSFFKVADEARKNKIVQRQISLLNMFMNVIFR